MTLKSCGYCKEKVDLSAGPHIHDPKYCPQCRTTKAASSFKPHPSSADGRRHTCMECLNQQALQTRQRQSIARDEEFQANNAKLKKYGYQWRRQRKGYDPDAEFSWVLLDPQGMEIGKKEALRRIAEIESPELEDFDYF